MFGYLGLEKWDELFQYIGDYVDDKDTVPAHELRFFVHLIILLKIVGRHSEPVITDKLIEQYSWVLIQMRLNTIVPFYLFHLSEEKSTEKTLDFLQGKRTEYIVKNNIGNPFS